jgi:hypothetical protein
MANYLADQTLKALSVDVEGIKQIAELFAERTRSINAALPSDAAPVKVAHLYYVIRLDNKGYRLFSLDDLLLHYGQARIVERLLFTVETGESFGSNRNSGTFLELRLDAKDPAANTLAVSSDDHSWVASTFAVTRELLSRFKNRNGWVQSEWTRLAAQLLALMLSFVLSLWAAAKIAPQLTIENAFVFCFIFLLLLISNMWAFFANRITRAALVLWPNIGFHKPSTQKPHWLMQAIVGGLVFAVGIYLLSAFSSFVVDVVAGLVNKTVK